MSLLPSSFVRTLGIGAALTVALTLPSAAQSTGRPDQIFVHDRGGEIKNQAGVVVDDGVNELVFQQRGRDKQSDAAKVDRIVFGDVPVAYRDAQGYANRGDFENAVRKFRVAADDSDARGPVRAKARFLAATMLMKAAALDPVSTPFTEVVSEFDTFLSDHGTSRLVPQARRMQARARWITGDAGAAAELSKAVYEALDSDGKSAYTIELCYESGLEAASAFLAAGNSADAGGIYSAMQTSLNAAMAEAEPDDRAIFDLLKQRAILGEGWQLIADGKHGQAVSFFNGKLRGDEPAVLRFNARLGLAEGLLGQAKYREAQLEFAAVSGLDHTSRDNVARALLGLARCAQAIPDTDSSDRIGDWLEAIQTQYGDTPAAASARQLAASL